MLVIDINGKQKDIPSDWSEMTLEYYCGIYQILQKYKRTEEQEKDDEGKDLTKFFFTQEIKMYNDLFCYMTGMSKENVKKVRTEEIEAVISSLDNILEDYKPTGMTFFEFEGETYYFPMDFFREGTFGEYIESTQLEMNTEYLKNGRFDILPEQMAILCKAVDEEVDLDNIDEKAKAFRKLTMDIVWEFAFFLNRQTSSSLNVIQTFLGVEAQKA
mgnify:CR=1 FL=1|jgi:hypothetical protein|tara:strand:+ start:856 stop:1500 length:645 start_codon:yes stop_codon:yes gene_type:complete